MYNNKAKLVGSTIQVKDVPHDFILIAQDREVKELIAQFGFTDRRFKRAEPVLKPGFEAYGYAFVSIEEDDYVRILLGRNCVPFNDHYLDEIVLDEFYDNRSALK